MFVSGIVQAKSSFLIDNIDDTTCWDNMRRIRMVFPLTTVEIREVRSWRKSMS